MLFKKGKKNNPTSSFLDKNTQQTRNRGNEMLKGIQEMLIPNIWTDTLPKKKYKWSISSWKGKQKKKKQTFMKRCSTWVIREMQRKFLRIQSDLLSVLQNENGDPTVALIEVSWIETWPPTPPWRCWLKAQRVSHAHPSPPMYCLHQPRTVPGEESTHHSEPHISYIILVETPNMAPSSKKKDTKERLKAPDWELGDKRS